MDDGRIPKDLLYGELREGVRGTRCPLLRHKDACKIGLKALDINELSWETCATDRNEWRRTLERKLPEGERNWIVGLDVKPARRNEIAVAKTHPVPSAFICPRCG